MNEAGIPHSPSDRPSPAGRQRVAVIGGGLSGLAAAWRLGHAGADVTLIEQTERTGGVIRSRRQDGFLCEAGPNSMLMKSQLAEDFLGDLGLDEEILDANPIANKRFLVRNGRVLPLPMSLTEGLTTPLYTIGAKFRLLAEPFVRAAAAGQDQSVAEFVTRRLGRQFLDYGIAALVSGIYAGDPEKLSIRYAFPKVWNLEARYGSLIGGAIRLRRDRKRRGEIAYKPRMVSFADGTETLTRRLAATASATIHTESELLALEPGDTHWSLRWRQPSAEQSGQFDHVVMAVPCHALGELPWPTRIGTEIRQLPSLYYPPVTTLVLGYRREQVEHPLNGFGMLIPLVEQRRVLGAIFSSTLFPGRAPDGHVALMIFMGGATMPDCAVSGEAEAARLATGQLADLLGIRGEPVFSSATHWPVAIPQYNVGHGDFIAGLEGLEQSWRGLHFCANYRGGPGLSDCLDSGRAIADRILRS
ncbi:MAG: protoporphyrinogen oxidase [Gammaproteobacteria bacterium]